MNYIDIDELNNSLPKHMKNQITPAFIEKINDMIDCPDYAELYAKNLITYTSVLKSGKYRLSEYFSAVSYVSRRLLGDSSEEAYSKVFPEKYKRHLMKYGAKHKNITSSISAYARSKLVMGIYEQTLMPDYLIYSSMKHAAIKKLGDLLESKSEHVQHKAADSLLNYLSPPQNTQVELNIPVIDQSAIHDLSKALSDLTSMQQKKLESGDIDISTIAISEIVSNER